jgi:hypothetical protein
VAEVLASEDASTPETFEARAAHRVDQGAMPPSRVIVYVTVGRTFICQVTADQMTTRDDPGDERRVSQDVARFSTAASGRTSATDSDTNRTPFR